MKVEVKLNEIKNKISAAEKITGKHTTLPVLQSVLLEAKKDTLFIKATNLEVGVEFKIPAKIEKEGKTAVKGSVLSGFFNALYDNAVLKIELVANNLSVTAGKHNTLFKTSPHDDFPNIPRINNNEGKKIRLKGFVEGLKTVVFASATSDIKPELASVLVYGKNKETCFVATDSFRLAEKKTTCGDVFTEQVLIPYKNCLEFTRVFEDVDEEGLVWVDKSQLSVETKTTYLTTRLTDGVYPNYKQIMPQTSQTQAVVLKDDLIKATKPIHTFLDTFNKVIMRVIAEDGILEIESKNPDVGEGVTQVDAHASGENVETGFNFRFLTDVFTALTKDSISFRFNGQHKPVVISPVGDDSFAYLIMPMHRG